jgi:hypothetical protein
MALELPVRAMIFESCSFWGLILSSMIDLLTSNVALLGNSTAYMVPIPPVYPDSHYYVECKYHIVPNSTVIRLMLLDTDDTSVGNFESGRFAIHM